MKISDYKPEYEDDVLAAIKQDPNWELFTNIDAVDKYRKTLKNSITFVCYDDNEFCGYVRAILDPGFAVYISELFVIPTYRGQKIGRALLNKVKTEFADLSVYVLSDEDAYYEKIGYKKAGSVFEAL